tara:strand:- start:983 stop:1459 length:477 start_codon:yes stop_codon:yes gene_type:complete
MVKNTQGGSKHKSQARKNAVPSVTRDIEPNGTNELYAHVTKMYGNGMCQVETHCDKKMTLVCHIRGKFRGKNKKHNTVALNSNVIIGLRDWETENKNCDLISILNSSFTSSANSNLSNDQDSFVFSSNTIDTIDTGDTLDNSNILHNTLFDDFDIDYI